MRMRTFITQLLAVALVSLGLVAAAGSVSPASATDNLTTKITIKASKKSQPYGYKYNYLSIGVKGSDGYSVYDGTVTLQKLVGKKWKTVKTFESSGYISYDLDRTKENTIFRATYSGYTATASYEDNYAPSTSKAQPLAVYYLLEVTSKSKPGGPLVTVKVGPKTKNKPVTFEKKVGSKWKKYAVKKTNNASKVTLKLVGKTGTKWKISVKGTKKLSGAVFTGRTV